jgi:plastocyanin
MKTKLLTLIFFLTVVFSFSQTETISITWNFLSVPDSDENSVVNTDITIEEGDTVEWVFEGFDHNVKSLPRGAFGTDGDDSTTYSAPFTYSYTFMDIGSFDFECVPHSSIMYGTITVVAEGTLSVDNVEKVDFSIYPNPSNYKLNIRLAQNSNAANVEVYDILGKRIYRQTLTSTQSSINVSRWNAGVYLVKITNDNGTQTKRFVKQ